MINFPKPKVPAPQFKGATRSKISRIVAEKRKKAFLAKAARSGLDAVNAALDAPAVTPESAMAEGTRLHQEAVDLPVYHRVNLGSVSEGQTASVDADGAVTRADKG